MTSTQTSARLRHTKRQVLGKASLRCGPFATPAELSASGWISRKIGGRAR